MSKQTKQDAGAGPVTGRSLRRRLWPIMGGRSGAVDRGRAPGVPADESKRNRRGPRHAETGENYRWKATGRPPWVKRAENRARSRRSRQARRAGRG